LQPTDYNLGDVKFGGSTGSGGKWIDKLTNVDTNLDQYKEISSDNKYWVWTYYNLAYDPSDDNSGDHMCIFMDNWQLYSGPIINADKEIPIVNFKFSSTRDYWSKSMVDDLRSVQDTLNRIDNIKRTTLEFASTSNLATNKNVISGDFSLSPHKVNVLEVDTQEESSIEALSGGYGKNLSVANVIQPLRIGNIEAIEANQAEIQNLLMEMDGLYPKPTYKTQGLAEGQQTNTLYSPNVEINNMIQRFTHNLSTVAEKHIKETIHSIKYMTFKDSKFKDGINLYGHLVKVVETKEEKLMSQAKKVVPAYNSQIEQENQQAQQASIQNPQQEVQKQEPIDPKNIKSVDDAVQMIAKAAQKKIVDATVYFIYQDMVLLGYNDLQVTLSFDKTKDQLVADTMAFIEAMKAAGVFVDASSLGERLSVLYGQDSKMIASQAPDPILQSLINSGGLRVNSLLYPSDGATESIISKFLQIDEKEFQWNPQDYNMAKWLMQSKITHQQAKELEMVKGDERTKTGVTTEGARGENKMKLAKEESINDKIGGAIGESRVRDGDSMIAGDLDIPTPQSFRRF